MWLMLQHPVTDRPSTLIPTSDAYIQLHCQHSTQVRITPDATMYVHKIMSRGFVHCVDRDNRQRQMLAIYSLLYVPQMT